jgi:hypothetical protein
MARELSIPLSISPDSLRVLPTPRSFASLAVPLIGSLFQTYGAVWLLCRTPWPHTLTWRSLFLTAAFFLIVTVLAHLFAVWFNRRIFRGQVDAPLKLLNFAIWPSVVWLPLLVLFVRESSPWAALVLPIISASAFVSLKRWFLPGRPEPTAPAPEGTVFTLFHPQTPPPFLRVLAPAFATSIALQGALAEILLGRPFFAGSLFAACTLFPIWVTPMRLQPFRAAEPTVSSVRSVAPRTLTVLILLAIALIPYLRSPILANGIQDLLGATINAPPKPASANSHIGAHAPGYTGIILTLPPKRQPKVLLSPPMPVNVTSLRRQPTIIPFDGEYWYFKQPYDRPDPASPVVRGDPTKKIISSTDARPLTMQAHQPLAAPVAMNCCTSIRLAIKNAETSPGPISVEILLRNVASKKPTTTLSLGTLVIPSSIRPRNPSAQQADDILNFPFPPHTTAHSRQFNEITVAITPPPSRSRTGAHVAVQYFELAP